MPPEAAKIERRPESWGPPTGEEESSLRWGTSYLIKGQGLVFGIVTFKSFQRARDYLSQGNWTFGKT